jgi:hypothetical protein
MVRQLLQLMRRKQENLQEVNTVNTGKHNFTLFKTTTLSEMQNISTTTAHNVTKHNYTLLQLIDTIAVNGK